MSAREGGAGDVREEHCGGGGRRDEGMARWLWLGALALTYVVFAQLYFGVGFRKTIEIDGNSLRADGGHAWKVKLPREHRTAAASHRLRVFEDGEAIGPLEANNRRVRQHGSGRYRLDANGTLRLSATDNSSPVFNGRRYTLEIPARVLPLQWLAAVVLLSAASFVAWRRGIPAVAGKSLWQPRPGMVASGLLVAALVVRFWALAADAGHSDGGFSVKGIPYSDALAWTELAHSLREGHGFQGVFAGQRPFYPVFMAGVYRVFGNALETGKAVNAVCGALSVVFLYLLVARVSGQRLIGLAAASVLLLSPQQLSDIHPLITEPMGLTLILAGSYAWWAGLLTLRPSTLFAAGALIGLSNLTRTFTLLGLPLFALVTLAACLQRGLHWRSTVSACALFTLGATCVLAPWMLRQKLRHDTFSLSTTGSDLLYSAAIDTPGWSNRLYDELEEAGLQREQLGEAHAFYARRFAAEVAKSPGRYVRRLAGWVLEYVTHHEYGQPLERLAVLSAGLWIALWAWWKRRVLTGAGFFLILAALAPLLAHLPPGLVLVASAGLALWLGDRSARWCVAVLLATLCGGALMSAMIGNFGMNRTSPLTGWVFTALLFAAIGVMAQRVLAGRSGNGDAVAGQERPAGAPAVWRGLPVVLSWGLLGLGGVAAAAVAVTGSAHPDRAAGARGLDLSVQARVRDWVREQLSGASEAPDDALFVSLVRIEPYHAVILAKEDTSHWARPFLPRPYTRTVAFVRVLPGALPGGSLMAVQFRGSIEDFPEGQTLVLAGVNHIDANAPLGHDVTMVEALALVPFDQDAGPDFDNARTFPVTPEAAAILAAPGAVAEPGAP